MSNSVEWYTRNDILHDSCQTLHKINSGVNFIQARDLPRLGTHQCLIVPYFMVSFTWWKAVTSLAVSYHLGTLCYEVNMNLKFYAYFVLFYSMAASTVYFLYSHQGLSMSSYLLSKLFYLR